MTTKILKRIASVVLAMSIVLSFALVNVAAAGGNLIDTIPSGVDINSGEVGCAVSGDIVTLTANSTAGTSSDWGMQGFEINEKFISTLQDGYAPVFGQETKVLISAKVRKAEGSTADAKINVSYSSWYNVAYESGSPQYTDTYPNAGDGFLVNSTEWMNFKAYITVPARTDGNTWAYLFGLSSGTAQGAKVEVDMSSMYFGAESAHDIEVTAVQNSVTAGTSTTATATIVNQIDEAFSGTQGGFDWYALTADRTAQTSGITVTAGADGTATVEVSNSVAAGKYDIVAVSDTYEGFIKGVEITVTNLKNDYTPTADGNMITTYPTEVYPDTNSVEAPISASDNIAILSANADIEAHELYGLRGFEINERFIPTLQDGYGPTFAQPTKVLISAKVRKAADATADAKINVAYSSWYKVQYEGGSPIYTDTYPSASAGFDVVSTEWTDFKAVMTVPTITDGNTWTIMFGFASGTAQGAKVEIDMESMYFGAESAHDIEVVAADETVSAGSSTTVTATIVNQIDEAFSGTQGGFSWVAMNADRTATASGITVTAGDNGTATVAVADTVAAGKYNIVAVSDTYEGYIKGVEINVGEKIEGITLKPSTSGVTVATDTALTNAQLIFVTYEANGKMVDFEVKYVTLSAQKSEEYAPSDLKAGSYTKAMLWSDRTNCIPLADMIRY